MYGHASVYKRLGKAQTCVYRCYDINGELLYIGCSIDPHKRIREHRSEQRLWATALLFRITIDVYENRVVAEHVEREAIKAERPHWNSIRYRFSALPVPRRIRVIEHDEIVLAAPGAW